VTAEDGSLDAPRRREAPCDSCLPTGSTEMANRAGHTGGIARRGARQQLGRAGAQPRLYRARTPRPAWRARRGRRRRRP
jgi:hypothetical protein